MVQVIEKLCASKTGVQEDCEDVIVIGDDYIAVIDGATSTTGVRFEGKTGGKIAAELIASCFQSGLIAADMDCLAATNRIQDELQLFAQKHQLEERGVHLCASAVIYSVSKRQIWCVGDCQFLLNGKHFAYPKKVDALLAEVRCLAIHMLLQSGHTEAELMREDLARELILPALRLQHHLENTDNEYGFSVFSSHGRLKHVHITDVPSGAEVILASDGYLELLGTLAASEAREQEFVRLDPLCYKLHQCTKGLTSGRTHFDDRSYIRFIVEGA